MGGHYKQYNPRPNPPNPLEIGEWGMGKGINPQYTPNIPQIYPNLSPKIDQKMHPSISRKKARTKNLRNFSVSDAQHIFSDMVSDAQHILKLLLNDQSNPMSKQYQNFSNKWKLVKSEPILNPALIERNNMKIEELNKEDMQAFNEWLDQREAELVAQEGEAAYWDEVVYGRQEREAREKYFKENPTEKYDSPDFYFERD